MSILKNLLIYLALLMPAFFIATPVANAAIGCNSAGLTAKQQERCGACEASGATDCTPGTAGGALQNIATTIVNILSILAGLAAVIIIIIGGFRYVTSGGKQESITAAKNTILYAIIGLVIVALAQIIVHFVLKNTSNLTATNSSSGSSSSTPGVSPGTANSPH